MFKLNDRVVIGGRTMLSPEFSLVGLTGRVVSSRADAPAGTVAVWVDWEEGGYTETEELPPVVNVPSIHLELADAIETSVAPHLTAVQPRATQSVPPSSPLPATKKNPFRLVD